MNNHSYEFCNINYKYDDQFINIIQFKGIISEIHLIYMFSLMNT